MTSEASNRRASVATGFLIQQAICHRVSAAVRHFARHVSVTAMSSATSAWRPLTLRAYQLIISLTERGAVGHGHRMGGLAGRLAIFVSALGLALTSVAGVLVQPVLAVEGLPALSQLHLPLPLLLDDESFDQQISSGTKGVLREVRRSVKTLWWMLNRAASWWGGWIWRGTFSLGIAIIAALADTGLLNAWRVNGWRMLISYVPMMLYVYGRLLFSAGVSLGPKLILAAALVYGAVRNDFIPDRRYFHGRIEDILLIALATRAFIYACPEALVDQYAARAISLHRRVMAFQQRAR
jgi:hypothetical protein